MSQLKQEGFQDQHLQIENQFKRLNPRSTKLKWELVTSNTLNTVKEFLESSDVGNIIIVTHSVGDYKKLIDSSFNQYPSTFFGRIAPQLMSLSFFTCHSETIMKVYDLERKISESESFHQRRVLNFVKDNTVLDDHQSVAIKGFTDYLLKIDKNLIMFCMKTSWHKILCTELHPQSLAITVPLKYLGVCPHPVLFRLF